MTPLLGGGGNRFQILQNSAWLTVMFVGSMGGTSSWLLIPLQFGVQCSQARNPFFFFFFFYQFRGIICLHEGNDMSLVLLPVLSIGFTCGQVISSFPVCQNSGKPRNLWIELPLLCKAPAPDERWVWIHNFSFAYRLLPSTSLYVEVVLYGHCSIPWLCKCMNFITALVFLQVNLHFAFQELLRHAAYLQTFEIKQYT